MEVGEAIVARGASARQSGSLMPPDRWSRSPRALAWVLVGVAHVVVFAPLVIQAVYHPDRWVGPDDFTTHLREALPETWREPWVPGPPHFVWHTLVKLVSLATPGSSYLPGAVITSLAFAAFGGIVWFEVLRMAGPTGTRMRMRWAAIGSLVLVCMESPSTLAGWAEIVDGQVWLPLHAYHGPTGPAARPLATLLVVGFVALATGPGHRHHALAHRWMPALAAVAAVTKPTMSVTLMPVVVVVMVVWSRRDARPPMVVAGPLLRRFVAPTVGIVVVQYTIMAYQVPPEYRQETILEPFRVVLEYQLYRPQFWSVLALPIAMLLAWRARLVRDRYVEVCLWSFAGGIGLLLLMSSTNLERDALAALWFLVHPVAIFLVFAVRRVAELLRTQPRPGDRAGLVVCTLLALVYVFSWLEFTSCALEQACLTS